MNKTLKRVVILVVMMLAIMTLLSVKTQALTNEEARSIVFDSDFYNEIYPDIYNAFHGDPEQSYNHFMTYGIDEGRTGSPIFDLEWYALSYNDLADVFVTYDEAKDELHFDYRGLYNHFLEYGCKEGRTGSFMYDFYFYRDGYKDLQQAFQGNREQYYIHYSTFGEGEGRQAVSFFNVKCYLKSYKDLTNAFKTDYRAGVRHVVIHGLLERRDKLTHKYEVENTPATCTTDGVRKNVCVNCGEGVNQKLPKLGHNYKLDTTKKATCTADGEEVYKCTRCGAEDTKVLPALGHDLGKITEHKDPVCVVDGYNKYTCSRCGHTLIETIPGATDHDYSYTPNGDNKTHKKVCKYADDCGDQEVASEPCVPVEGGWTVYEGEGAGSEKYEVNKCSVCGGDMFRSKVDAIEDSEDEATENNVVELKPEDIPEEEGLTIPEGKEVKIEGQIEAGKEITVSGKLTVTELPAESASITAEEDAIVELETNKATDLTAVLGDETKYDYVTDITLTDSVELSDTLTVKEEKEDVKVDLGEKVLSSATSQTAIEAEGDLTLSNGTVTVTAEDKDGEAENQFGIVARGDLIMTDVNVNYTGNKGDSGICTFGDVTITGGTINVHEFGLVFENATEEPVEVTVKNTVIKSDYNSALSTNGKFDNVNITLDNVTAKETTGQYVAAYFPAEGKVTIIGGTYSGGTAIETCAAELDIQGATLEGHRKRDQWVKEVSDGSLATGSALVIFSRGGYLENDETKTIKVTIDGETTLTFEETEKQDDGKAKANKVEVLESTLHPSGPSCYIDWANGTVDDILLMLKDQDTTVESVELKDRGIIGGSKKAE